MPNDQPSLFATPVFVPPEKTPGGFLYREDFLSVAEEQALLAIFQALPFKRSMHESGYEAFRRHVGYGWEGTPPLPGFFLAIRDRAAALVGLPPAALDSALINEYSPGAAIGWHRDKTTDKNADGHVVGVSLGAACQFRLRRARWPRGPRREGQKPLGYDRFNLEAAPRSVYCMRHESWRHWQHSIPKVEALRYSITFRNF